MNNAYRISCAIARWIFRLFAPLAIEHGERLPAQGRAILCANHMSYADPVALACAFARPIHFMAKAELFRNRLFGRYLRALGTIPVKRGKSDLGAIRKSIALLETDAVLGIFPEGTRAEQDLPLMSGISLIALKTGAPVYPVRIRRKFRLFRKLSLCVGTPVDLSELYGRTDSATIAQATERIEIALRNAENH